ncbi:FAD-binding oxidoreductase [Cognaticolwellia mytili]|uniref:FAD-binding oxidoreductase n=1 Tax=Cognaticolwellia mytili TaxID=1888913 RepID=UPI000A175984|nr:pyridoxamine 5'-phosphate oxidase family protein [Cognaticolwellia mytili]
MESKNQSRLTNTSSPFHAGEQELQSRSGKRDAMEKFGQRAIRAFMPDQHRKFFAQLPFIVIGSVDNSGWPWASILPGRPGFASSPTPTRLDINIQPINGDPLAQNIQNDAAPLGLLGIELHTRRRNRLNGRVVQNNTRGFSVAVDQSFGNCPQYIQHRSVDFIREPNKSSQLSKTKAFSKFSSDVTAIIGNADTFFVSSFVQSKDRPDIEGVDVSHRGGKSGFVKVDGNTLTIPDYSGNYHFNTLGNFLINPKAGLIFTDFTTGDIHMLTGTVEIIWDLDEELSTFQGAERAWKFTLDHGLTLKDGLPFRSTLGNFSPNSLLTGNWAETKALIAAKKLKGAWRPFNVTRIEDESDNIRSFYFQASDSLGLPTFEAGQFITLKITPDNVLGKAAKDIIRTYTVSSAPGENYYRISVKKESQGLASKYLHELVKVGDVIELKTPRGEFFIDSLKERPAVLIAGGVGITPMMSMAQHIFNEGVRRRHLRPLFIFYSARTTKQRAFSEQLNELQRRSDNKIKYYSFITAPTAGEKVGVDFNSDNRISIEVLQQVLPLDAYDFYLCGPTGFMQDMYNKLHYLGIAEHRIFAESFGPAVISRSTENSPTTVANSIEPEEAEESIITFAKSAFEQRWQQGGSTLLEVAEAHGLTPEFGCRTGACGACKVKLNEGNITYRTKPTAEYGKNEVLICCAVPEKNSENISIDL